ASHYDAFTAHHDYEAWTTTIEELARGHGLRGRRLLDVACGTGKSLEPFVHRGYTAVGCDLSQPMLDAAAAKLGPLVRLERHDLRDLPRLGAFDLVCCLDDALNYLVTSDELCAALSGLAANLAPDGVLVFDVNSLRCYRTFFASLTVVPSEDHVLVWDGQASPTIGAGEVATSFLQVLERGTEEVWTRRECVHYQRHHSRDVVEAALRTARLRRVGLYGMHLDGSVSANFSESDNSKALYIARLDAPEGERR
ncbi:MAG TPA: class I SAM-dependent methyltransferase, partial [Solirubrobacteraceae bacterium]